MPPSKIESVCHSQRYILFSNHSTVKMKTVSQKPPLQPPVTMLPRVRVVVADDHPVVRAGVRNMLEVGERVTVLGEAVDGDDAITQTLELAPDVLLLDLQMPKL